MTHYFTSLDEQVEDLGDSVVWLIIDGLQSALVDFIIGHPDSFRDFRASVPLEDLLRFTEQIVRKMAVNIE